jgi:hypothetical protein
MPAQLLPVAVTGDRRIFSSCLLPILAKKLIWHY